MSERIVQLERNAVKNAQYHRRESLEINLVSTSIGNGVLKGNICKAFSLTGHEVKPENLLPCHRLKKKETVIVKFKCRKQNAGSLVTKRASIIN